jgi:hypothetical protein
VEVGDSLPRPTTAGEEGGIAPEIQERLGEVCKDKPTPGSIDPKVVILRAPNIGAVTETGVKEPATGHHRGMVERIAAWEATDNFHMAERHELVLKMTTLFIDLTASCAEDINIGMGS